MRTDGASEEETTEDNSAEERLQVTDAVDASGLSTLKQDSGLVCSDFTSSPQNMTPPKTNKLSMHLYVRVVSTYALKESLINSSNNPQRTA